MALFFLLAGAGPALADEVMVAVAANFTDATREIVPRFEAASGHTVKVSFGSSGKLYAQIRNGAPFQLFLSADADRPERLEADGLGVAGTRFTYARGRLALWSAAPGRVDAEGAVLRSGDFARVAIANPRTAPYGLAAEQVMERLGVLEAVRPKLVRGDSIAQTFQFIATGNAQIGFVALSQVKALDAAKAGSSWTVPQSLYEPIDQQAILIKGAERSEAAKAFLAFLKSDEARAVIEGFGYGTASE
jgi:molybdate transport system substrate-binding protein